MNKFLIIGIILQVAVGLTYITADVLVSEKLLKSNWFTPDPFMFIMSVLIVIISIMSLVSVPVYIKRDKLSKDGQLIIR